MMKETAHIYFSGRVQGVGFRFTCRSLALKHSIKGWVRNMPDGRVELSAQASFEKVVSFLNDLRQEFKGYILNEEIEWLKPEEDCEDFIIRF